MSENDKLTVEDVINDEESLKTILESDKVKTLIQKQIADALDPIKGKLDGAFDERDKALEDARVANEKVSAEKIKNLEDTGKTDEAMKLRLDEAMKKISDLETGNTKLSRDVMVRDQLKGLEFANDKAAALAYRSVVDELKQDESGNWVHNSGKSVSEFVKEYSESEDNSFLFKVKQNSGGGSNPIVSPDTPNPHEGKSLFDLSEADVLKLAGEGKLPVNPNHTFI